MNDDIIDEQESYQVTRHLVGNNIRFLNFIIDSLIIALLSSGYSPILGILPFIFELIFEDTDAFASIYNYIIPVFNFLLYYFLFEVSTQQTIGKIITRTKVYTLEGYKPSPIQIILRTLLRMIPIDFITFLGGYKMHDRLSNTVVAKISKF